MLAPAPAPTFHALRHSHASALSAQGWDVQEVATRLGHSSVAATLRTYAHEVDAAQRSTERRRRLSALYAVPSMEARVEAKDRRGPQEADRHRKADSSPTRAIGGG